MIDLLDDLFEGFFSILSNPKSIFAWGLFILTITLFLSFLINEFNQ